MPPASPLPEPEHAPPGRLRLAAVLGGAGALAMGLGAGVVGATAQDPDGGAPSTPADEALGSQTPTTAVPAAATTTTATTEAAPAATTSSTPLPDPAPAGDATAPAEPAAAEAATPPAEVPAAAASDAAEAVAAVTVPADASPPAAAADAPKDETEDKDAPVEPAVAPAYPPAPPAPGAPAPVVAQPTLPEVACAPASEEVLTIQGAEEDAEVQCEPVRKPARKRTATARKKHDEHEHGRRAPSAPAPIRNAGGVPTMANPTTSLVMPGPAAIGVPNFFIDRFRIPPFLLPIYQAAGIEYGIRWEILAAINEIETDYGRNLNVSSAGALGWMQFMPATWKAYGVDANGDKKKDPYNPVDAIFAAARYLKASGGDKDLRKAIFAYNHADWYVDSVLMRARIVGGLPADLVGSLTGLTDGRFPVDAKARYADDLSERGASRRVAPGDNAAVPVDGDAKRRGIHVFTAPGAHAIATHDGQVVQRGTSARLGRYVKLRDASGNTYTYARLRSLAVSHPVAKRGAKPKPEPKPTGRRVPVEPRAGAASVKERLFAHPVRPKAYRAGGNHQVGVPVPKGRTGYAKDLLGLDADQVTWKRLKPGTRVVAGTVLGTVGKTTSSTSPHLFFEIRPAGRGAPRIDPKPILDGWKLLETTAIYRARSKNPFHGKDAKAPTIGQILLMSKEALQRRVLTNPRIDADQSGRLDVRSGRVDRRVLALLEYLSASGLRPTVSSLYREGSITTSGNLSHHATGTAVDISAINGISIMGHQGEGSVTDIAIRRLLNLQGSMRPDQIISLMTYPDASNTVAMGDHADHIHVGFRPMDGDTRKGARIGAQLKPGQWFRVIDRLNRIENPVVRKAPSSAALKVTPKRRAR